MQIEAAANKKTIWMEYSSLALYFSTNERGTFSVSKVVPNVWRSLLTLKDVNPTVLVHVIFTVTFSTIWKILIMKIVDTS